MLRSAVVAYAGFCVMWATGYKIYHSGENLLLKCVAVQKQTVNLGIGSGSRVCQTVYEKVVC